MFHYATRQIDSKKNLLWEFEPTRPAFELTPCDQIVGGSTLNEYDFDLARGVDPGFAILWVSASLQLPKSNRLLVARFSTVDQSLLFKLTRSSDDLQFCKELESRIKQRWESGDGLASL